MNDFVHVFVGAFSSHDEACSYTQKQWEPEPDGNCSDEEYRAWESRNPTWQMRNDLGDPYLDGDFIETIDGADRFDYLAGLMAEPELVEHIKSCITPAEAFLVLIFEAAFGGFPAEMQSTPLLRYCGKYSCKL